MINQLLLYIGAAITFLWGVSHLFPTKNVVKGFGDITADNKNIITMEWINEGAALIFTGVIVAGVTFWGETNNTAAFVYVASSVFLIVLAVISLFSGFRIKFLPFKLCPVLFTLSATDLNWIFCLMLTYLVFGITYAFAASIQPGPFQTFIISQTMKIGWKRTLPAALAPVLSDIPIIILILLILTNIPSGFLHFLQIGGGLLLLYLAYGSFRSFLNFEQIDTKEIKSDKTLFKAVLVNLLNPNPYLGWSLIMGPLFIKGYNEAAIDGITLVAAFYTTLILCQGGIIILFGLARNLGPKVTRITLGIASVGLAVFGVYLLLQGIMNNNSSAAA